MLKKVAVLAVFLGIAFGAMMLSTSEKTFEVENSLTIGRPAAEIWPVLTDVERWKTWWPGMQKAQLQLGWKEGAPLELILKGTPEKKAARVETVVVGRELAWVRSGILKSVTRTSLRLEPVAGGTRVSLKSFIQGPQAFLAGFTGKEEFAGYHEAVLAGLKAFTEQAGRQ